MTELLDDQQKRQESDDQEIAESEAPLMEHLVELRQRLIYSLAAIAVFFVVAFFFASQIFNVLLGPFERAVGNIEDVELIYTAPQEFFFTQLKVALFTAIFLAFPLIATQIYRFIAPGLYKRERKAFLPFIVATPILFVLGASLVYFGVMPLALKFFISLEQTGSGQASIQMVTRVSEYLSLTMTLLLAFGFCFQLPVVLVLLATAELISSDNLKSWRKYAIVGILTLAAFLTPPEPMTQIGLAVPVFLLYELSIFAVRFVERSRKPLETDTDSSN
ncbi:twin-arginine translocase subunit TatC [Maritalea mediterranea]|uniref:Sec-independent protein translocase protein TatC n=1 Tax=Maritalea mediterranea TaxID=2909667 RepID=A0ABS9EA43_9HYPH|nr:twin-arginine translocase subunit TatC [Maritalea mediterranea]MCF4098283.1 twin-arginine translocase subunit TatC [Maritalea mediterranea]